MAKLVAISYLGLLAVGLLALLRVSHGQQIVGEAKYWPLDEYYGGQRGLAQAVDSKVMKLLEAATAAGAFNNEEARNSQPAYILDQISGNTGNNEPMAVDYMDISADQSIVDPAIIEQLRQQFIGDKSAASSSVWTPDLNSHDISGPVNDPMEFQLAADKPAETGEPALEGQLVQQLMRLRGNLTRMQQQQEYRLLAENPNGEPAIKTSVRDFITTNDDDGEVATSTSSDRDHEDGGEYIDHPLALSGHLYVQGGAGEGRQLLGPDGTFENVQVVKTDHAVPSYCDPPNPCPEGFTAKDGCLEDFVNSASFSREYQAKQQCACDNEHSLFNCASPMTALKGTASSSSSASSSINDAIDENNNNENSLQTGANDLDSSNRQQGQKKPTGNDDLVNEVALDNDSKGYFGDKLSTLARAIQNRFGSMGIIKNLISSHEANRGPENAENDNRLLEAGDKFAIYDAGDETQHYTRDTRKSPIIMD